MISLHIDGRSVAVAEGQTILEAAASAGITIPTLCHHPDLSPVGSCRVCLVDAGTEHLVPACKTLVQDGQIIETNTPHIREARRFVLELLLQNYRDDSDRTEIGDSEFLSLVREYGVQREEVLTDPPRFVADSDPHPFIRVNLNKCILCTRCLRACDEVQGRFVWHLAERGHDVRLVAGTDTTMLQAGCESCGACVAYCPTGALQDRLVPADHVTGQRVTTTCGYCGVGCQFDLNVRDHRVVGVSSNPKAPVNGMALCVKGRYGYGFLHHADRLTSPRVRRYLLDGSRKPALVEQRGDWIDVDWGTALRIVVERFARIHGEDGPGALALLASAKCTNEENYLVQKLARQVLGTNNVDHCARLCHSSTVAGLAMSFGSGAMSNSMADVAEQAAAFFVIGSNTTEQHPVFGARLRQAVHQRGAKLLVADPRRIDLCDFATLHIRQRPGTDVALLNGLMRMILERGDHDASFIESRSEGFEAFRESLAKYTPEFVSQTTGVSVGELEQAAELLGQSHPLAVIWAMGITQHTTGVLNVLALANLQMLLGNMGVPGGGVNPLRGQNNVQGACDMGALPNVFPGYQAVTDAKAQSKFSAGWAMSPDSPIASRLGLTVTEMLAAAKRGDVRGLFILGEDPALTEPDSNHARRCLAATEFVVLQEILNSETAAYADVLLPGSAFAEKDGTFTNTERRVQLVRAAITPPGIARPDWWILSELGNRLMRQLGREPVGPQAAWSYAHPRDILREIAELTPSYAGISFERLERGDQLQWPVPTAVHPGTPILHVDQFTRGKGKFHVTEHLPARELPDAEFPFLLTTGRVLVHWHGGELTRRVPGIVSLCPESTLELSPDDAVRLQIQSGDALQIRSRRGEMLARANVTSRVSPGIVFANFHFPAEGNANNLTINAVDPVAKIPEYKVCAVSVALAASDVSG
jgi:formate dehydrogenase alpha subunit